MMESTAHRYYQNSGAIPFLGSAAMMIAGLGTAVVIVIPLTVIPQFANSAIMALACSLGYAVLIGLAVHKAVRVAHVRNPEFARCVGLIVALIALYFAWVAFVWTFSGFNPPVLRDRLVFPQHLLQDIDKFAKTGVWSIADFTPRGWQLYTVWGLEAGLTIILVVMCSARNDETYCEHCRTWTKDSGLLIRMPLCDKEQLKASLESEHYGILDELRRQPHEKKSRLQLTVSQCRTCAQSSFLSIEHVKTRKDENGKDEEYSEPVIRNLIVPRDLVDHLHLPAFEGSPEYGAVAGETHEEAEVLAGLTA